MILLQVHEWLGPKRDHPAMPGLPTERVISFASELTLPEALRRIKKLQDSYAVRHEGFVVEFRLLSVSDLPGATPDDLEGLCEFLDDAP